MSSELRDCNALIQLHFGLNETEFTTSTHLNELESALTKLIKHLLDHDFQRLLNAFYKIDISENKLSEILSSSPPDDLSKTLAKEVIQREMQKVKTRQKYKKG